MKQILLNPLVITYFTGLVIAFFLFFHAKRSLCEPNKKIPNEVYKETLCLAVGWPIWLIAGIAILIYFREFICAEWRN